MWNVRWIRLSSSFFRVSRVSRLRRRFGSGNRGGANGNGKNDIRTTNDPGPGGWVPALWAAYIRELELRPVLTKMWTSGLTNAIGDVVAQHFFADHPFDWHRLFVFTNLGIFLVGPALHYWYGILGRIFVRSGFTSALGALCLDQFAFAPCFCATIIATLVAVETSETKKVIPKLQQDLLPTVLMNWKIWIPAQLINFWVVPPALRVLFANMVALIWTTYLSYASHKRIS